MREKSGSEENGKGCGIMFLEPSLWKRLEYERKEYVGGKPKSKRKRNMVSRREEY